LPQGRELEILETVRGQVPGEVFTTEYKNPVGGSPENVRNNLREGMRLLKEAGYEIKDRKLVGANGAPLESSSFYDPSSSGDVFFKPSLERSDSPQRAQHRRDAVREPLRSWVFDIVVRRGGNRCRRATSSASSGARSGEPPRSRNRSASPTRIDKLDRPVIFATDRDDIVAATKALSRVSCASLRVPQWTYGRFRTARWDRLGRPTRAEIGMGLPGNWCSTRRGPTRSAGVLERSDAASRFVLGGAMARRRRGGIGADGRRRREVPYVGLRELSISGLPPFRLSQHRRAQGRSVLDDPLQPRLQPVVPDLNSLKATSSRATARRDGQDFASLMVRAGDEPTPCTACAAQRAHRDGQADLSFFDAAGGALPRRQQLTARDAAFSLTPEGEGPSIIRQQLRDMKRARARRRDGW